MPEHDSLLDQLLSSKRVSHAELASAPTEQGVYVLWLKKPQMCLKVGRAGPRRGEGLRGRLALHFKSAAGNSVLARHLVVDEELARDVGFNLAD